MWRPENNVQEELVCFPRQVLGIELRSDGPWQGLSPDEPSHWPCTVCLYYYNCYSHFFLLVTLV